MKNEKIYILFSALCLGVAVGLIEESFGMGLITFCVVLILLKS